MYKKHIISRLATYFVTNYIIQSAAVNKYGLTKSEFAKIMREAPAELTVKRLTELCEVFNINVSE